MIKLKIIIFILLISFQVHAIDLFNGILQFFQKRDLEHSKNMHLIIHTPIKKHVQCNDLKISLINKHKKWGIMNIFVSCGSIHQYFRIELQVIGKYVKSSKDIFRGTKLTLDNLTLQEGRLDLIPMNVFLKIEDVLNNISSCFIKKDVPISIAMFKPVWLINSNQYVSLIIKGYGFKIFAKVKALNNAQSNQKVYVLSRENVIFLGNVDKYGNVIIYV